MGATVFYESSSELATLTNTFTVSGTATDPTTVSLTVTTPTGAATTYTWAGGTVTRTSAGVFTKDIACSEDGIWQYVWTGTGDASDVTAGTWTVFSTELTKMYCSVEELKSRLGLAAADTADDFELRLAVESAARWVDGHCHRRFYRASETRTYVPVTPYRLAVDDLVSVTTLKTDASGDGTFETTWATTDYQLLPHNPTAAPEQTPYTHLRAVGSYTFPTACTRARQDRVQVVGVFGWPQVPAAIKQATLVVAAETFKRKDTFAGQGGLGEFGPVLVRRDPQVLDLLNPYRVAAGFA